MKTLPWLFLSCAAASLTLNAQQPEESDLKSHLQQIESLRSDGKPQQALELALSYLPDCGHNSDLLYVLGCLYFELSQYSECRTILLRIPAPSTEVTTASIHARVIRERAALIICDSYLREANYLGCIKYISDRKTKESTSDEIRLVAAECHLMLGDAEDCKNLCDVVLSQPVPDTEQQRQAQFLSGLSAFLGNDSAKGTALLSSLIENDDAHLTCREVLVATLVGRIRQAKAEELVAAHKGEPGDEWKDALMTVRFFSILHALVLDSESKTTRDTINDLDAVKHTIPSQSFAGRLATSPIINSMIAKVRR